MNGDFSLRIANWIVSLTSTVLEKSAPITLFWSTCLYYPGPGLSMVYFEKSVLFTPLKKHDDAT